MIDLETLGIDDDAVISQIGAVVFDLKTFEVYGEFRECINIIDLKKRGFSIDKDTMNWWSKQDLSVRNSAMNGKKPGNQVAEEFNEFLNYHFRGINFDVWSNGILFDVPKIDYFMLYYDFAPLSIRTKYNRIHDFRTIRNQTLNLFRGRFTKVETTLDSGTQHDALDDSRWQVNSLQLCLKMMAGDKC